jgi:hypothetical protein
MWNRGHPSLWVARFFCFATGAGFLRNGATATAVEVWNRGIQYEAKENSKSVKESEEARADETADPNSMVS